MKQAILVFFSLGLIGCAAQQTQQTSTNNQPVNTNPSVLRSNSDVPSVSSSHSNEQLQSPHAVPPGLTNAPAATSSNSGTSGSDNGRSPMERAVDTSVMDAAIEKAALEFKQKPNDAAAKTALADAYFARATALTEASQYRSALGDYRRGLKLDPGNTEAKGMQDQIISIFQSLNREPPREGAEPTPLPFKKA